MNYSAKIRIIRTKYLAIREKTEKIKRPILKFFKIDVNFFYVCSSPSCSVSCIYVKLSVLDLSPPVDIHCAM